MYETLDQLIRSIRLEELDTNLFRGNAGRGPGKRIYGGQVLAQALNAAEQTVNGQFQVHSLNSYFLRLGDNSRPVIYEVDPIRDGRSFCTRRVVARQYGKAIFSATISFQIPEQSFEHQAPMPEVPGPEGLASDAELYSELFGGGQLGWPLEFRQVAPIDHREPRPMEPASYVWFKAAEAIDEDEDLCLHQQLLAYASDNPILVTALRPHGVSFIDRNIIVITLDHTLWFHQPLRVDDWLLYEVHSDIARNGRGLARGRIFNRSGELVVSVAQEGVLRRRRQ